VSFASCTSRRISGVKNASVGSALLNEGAIYGNGLVLAPNKGWLQCPA